MGMMGERRSPGMQYGSDTDAGAEMLGVGGDRDQGLGGGLEQDAVDRRLVLISDVGDLSWQGKDHVEIGHRQELGLARGQPVPGRRGLAFGAVAVAAGVVGDLDVGTVLAPRDMAAECCRAAALNCRHDLELAEAQVACLGSAPGRSMGTEDIRDLQLFARHDAAGSSGRQGTFLK